MIILKIAIVILVSWLWALGGQQNKRYIRLYEIPLILALMCLIEHSFWGYILVLLGCQSFRIGYGNYMGDGHDCWLANLTKDRKGYIIRALWGLLVTLSISLSVVLSAILYHALR